MSDLSAGITGSLSRDGLGGMRANLQMGGFRATNMADGVADTDAATVGQIGNSGVPIGVVSDFAGAAAPTGWLLCYGQAVSRTTYAALFAAIGTAYGAGDGTTTFNIPDCRGRASAGKDDMGGTAAGRLTSPTLAGSTLGATGGAQTHQLTIAQLAAHNHGVNDSGHSHSYNGIVGGFGSIQSGAGAYSPAGDTTGSSGTGISIQSNGSNEAHNNVQPTIVFNKIVRAL